MIFVRFSEITVLLAALNGLGPVTGVFVLVVKETSDTELFGGGVVPAGPVTDAGRLMTEDAVVPVADSSASWRV